MSLEFPGKLRFLFKPARVKGCYGGRGSGKSWGFARALLVIGAGKRIRVLCAREVQKSIQQSVHQLLSDQVASLGLDKFYEVLQTEIRGKNGTEFYFAGLSNETAESLKSYEGVTHCWIEEASNISKHSWDILIPTIRAEGSEIWMTFNPQLETDETYQRFVKNPPPDCVMVQMNYADNPYFPKVLEAERAHAQATMRVDDYRHVWLGQCKPAVEGAIYFDAMSAAIAAGRIRDIPHDGSIKTHVIVDLGWNDATTIILAQKVASEIRIIHYIEGNQRTLADYSAELKALRLDDQPMNWGDVWLPHDGFHVRHQTGKDDAAVMRGLGWSVAPKEGLTQTSIINGINRSREVFPRIYFNKTRTERLVECLKRYRWNISQKTGEAQAPLHDEYSHGCLDGETLVLTSLGNVKIKDVPIGAEVWTPSGFAKVLNSGPTKIATEIIEIITEDGTQILATPEHRIFTTRGVVEADTLRHTDAIFTKESAPCISYQSIKSMGYRDAVIESFKEMGIGSGSPEGYTHLKKEESSVFSIWKYTKHFTVSLSCAAKLGQLTGTLRTLIQAIGQLFARSRKGSTKFKSLMESGSTSSQRATTKQITSSMAASRCIGMYGRSTTGQSQVGCTSTTLTGTSQTTLLGTLNYSLQVTTAFITAALMNGLVAMRIKSSSYQSTISQRNGMQAMRELNGIKPTGESYGKEKSGTSAVALNAEPSFLARSQTGQSSAIKIAKLRRFAGVEAKRLVYDLTVEKHHCYLANGLLVSNCDALRYLCLASDSLTNDEWSGGKLNYPSMGMIA